MDGARSCQFSWSEPADRVSLGRAEADSPSPRNGSKHPVSQIGSRNIPRIIQTGDGECLEHVNTTEWFIGGLAPKSGGFAIGIARALPEESQARPPIGRKQIGDSEKDFRRGMKISLKSYERAKPWLSGNGRISSWRTIPSRPCALRKHTKRTSGAQNTSRLRLVQADWWTSPRIRSTFIFANVFDSESASRPSS